MSGLTSIWMVALLSFATGVISKTSDLFNDDGLRWFRGASPLSGVLWGISGSLLVLVNQYVAALWLATVMYWFLRQKLDHFNHAFAGVCISATGFYAAVHGRVDFVAFALLLAWLAVSGYLNTWLKDRYGPRNRLLSQFLRLRLRYYAGPVVLAVVVGDPLVAVSVLAGMLGTELTTVWWSRAEASARASSSQLQAAGERP